MLDVALSRVIDTYYLDSGEASVPTPSPDPPPTPDNYVLFQGEPVEFNSEQLLFD